MQKRVESLKSELIELDSQGCEIRFLTVEENFAEEAKHKDEELDADLDRLRQELEKVLWLRNGSHLLGF